MLRQFRFAILVSLGLAFAFGIAWRPAAFPRIGLKGSAGAAACQAVASPAKADSIAQGQAGSTGQSASAISSSSNNATVAATLTDHKMTAGPLPAQCVAPAAKYNFTPTDAQA